MSWVEKNQKLTIAGGRGGRGGDHYSGLESTFFNFIPKPKKEQNIACVLPLFDNARQ